MPAHHITLRVPSSQLAKIDHVAALDDATREDTICRLLDRALELDLDDLEAALELPEPDCRMADVVSILSLPERRFREEQVAAWGPDPWAVALGEAA